MHASFRLAHDLRALATPICRAELCRLAQYFVKRFATYTLSGCPGPYLLLNINSDLEDIVLLCGKKLVGRCDFRQFEPVRKQRLQIDPVSRYQPHQS